MHTLRLRAPLLVGLSLALGLAVVLVPRPGMAQFQPDLPFPGEPQPEPPKASVDKLTFPENRDTSLKFEAVLDYLNRAKPDWKVVCELSQGLLDAKSDYFYQFNANSNDPRADKRRVSVKEEINRLIGTFAKEGKDYYQLNYGGPAIDLLDRAKKNNFDRGLLAEAAQRYFHTKAGAEAARLLAGIHLQLGNYAEAAYGYTRLLLRSDADQVMDAKSLVKAGIALKRAGDGTLPNAFADLWATTEKKLPRDGIQFGREILTAEQVKAEWDRKIALSFGPLGDAFVGMYRGNAARNGVSAAGTPFLIPTYTKPILYREETANEKAGAAFVREGIKRTYDQTKKEPRQVPIPAGFPVTAPNLVMIRGYDGVYAYHSKEGVGPTGKPVRAGDLAWFSPSVGAAQSLWSGEEEANRSERDHTRNAWAGYWQTKMPSVLIENPNQGSLSHDGKLAYFVDDMAIPPAPTQFNPNMGFPRPGMPNPSGPPGMKDYSRLVAVEVDTGSVAWRLGGLPTAPAKPAAGGEDDDANYPNAAALTDGSYFLGPPLPYNGKLYALFERAGAIKLACLDPFKTVQVPSTSKDIAASPAPDVLWVQNLGKTMTPLGQDPLRRIQASFLACADGVIVCPTNSGAVVAVDLNARSLLWAHTYATVDQPVTGPAGPGGIIRPFPRPGMPQQVSASPLVNERWRSAGPIISGGRVIVAAYDSDQVQCIDLRTGKLLWSEARQPNDLYVGGVANNRVIIVGSKGTRAVSLYGEDAARKVPAPAWPHELRTGIPCGHGVIGKDGTFYLPMVGDDVNTDARVPQIWAINPATGLAVSKTVFRLTPDQQADAADNRLMLGNIVFHDSMMFSQSPTLLSAFPLIEAKRKEMDATLAKNPNDPVGLTSRGELLLDDGQLLAAIADFKKAQASNPTDATRAKIADKLYMAYTEILRNKFADGEKFLAEYKTLCELPPTAADGPERQRQLDEQVRRRGLYYSLVAEGREKQGRLVEAFQNFQAYAALGEKGRLLPVPGDPNTLARSDVWASGRIDAMLRNAKTDEARKPLEAQVNAEWAAVRSGNDLKRLGDFVKVFGPYFATGREAQFLLAEKLMLTNNEADRVQAEAFLLGLLGQTRGDPTQRTVTARATEALARLMTARTLMEDAVGLYARLGTEYADVVVRDGKTGADIYSDLITDKQLWPALELPQPVALTGAYKVDIQTGGGIRNTGYHLSTDGDQLPFVRRHRFALEVNTSDNQQTVILKMIDRVTETENAKVTGLPGFYNPQTGMNALYTAPGMPLLAVHGHLALLHCGHGQFIHCFDLSTAQPGKSGTGALGKELWAVNLLGKNAPTNSMQYNQGSAPDGDPVAQSADEWQIRLGKAMVLRASYASYITRDGLVTVNPLTGDPLWTRAGVSGLARLAGDATHLYLFETAGKNTLLRVLRAADGALVGTPRDLTGLLPQGQIRLFGRHILLAEGGPNEVRRLRLQDLVDGQDVWVKEAPAGSVPLRSENEKLCGYLTQDGKVEVIDAPTGQVILSAAVDADKVNDHLKDGKKFAVVAPLVMADADRCYLFLNRRDDSQANQRPWNGYPQVASVQMDGHLYAFSRATGKRLWYTESQLRADANQNQQTGPQVVLERFDELPCVVSISFTARNVRGQQQSTEILAIDKKTGALKGYREFPQNYGYQPFTGVTTDGKGGVTVTSNSFSVKMTPTDEKK